jgi:prepilin-type N-terminal cleavage/methylation domain-containing protein
MSRRSGFTLVEIMIVVAIIGLLAAIAIPSFMKARALSQKNACINNLRQIDGAKEQAALELKWTNNQDISSAANMTSINSYIKGLPSTNPPTCAGGGTYTYNPISSNPACSLTSLGHVLSAP